MIYLIAGVAFAFYTWGFIKAWQTRDSITRSTSCAWLVSAGLVAHTGFTHLVLFGQAGAQLSLPYVINLVALIITMVVTLVSFRLPIDRLLILVLPLSLLSLLVALTVAPQSTQDSAVDDLDAPLLAHILLSLAAYSALLLAACQSILLAVLDRQLKSPQRPAVTWLPPLETMEHLLLAMLWIGWVLLTLSIVSGFLFLDDMFAQRVAHHIVITSLSWLVYTVFLAGRYLFGWRGLTAVRWTLVAFTLLVIGYLGSKFVIEYLLA
ncbi:MAG: cytochrome c biogenesis protein CcsA [Pseudomonadales bacterium]